MVHRLLAFPRPFVFAAPRLLVPASAHSVARTAAGPAAHWLPEAAAVVFGVEQLQHVVLFGGDAVLLN